MFSPQLLPDLPSNYDDNSNLGADNAAGFACPSTAVHKACSSSKLIPKIFTDHTHAHFTKDNDKGGKISDTDIAGSESNNGINLSKRFSDGNKIEAAPPRRCVYAAAIPIHLL